MAFFSFVNTFKTNLTQGKDEGADSVLDIDPFVESGDVFGLNSNNFKKFIKTKDVALVMFYEPKSMQSRWSRRHFRKAAEETNRPGHVYAAVNCDQEGDFCVNIGVPKVPYFNIYTKGKKVDFFEFDPNSFLYEDMKKWVEGIPVSRS